MYENITFSGGSNKGISYLGVLRCLEKNTDVLKNIKNISGASIGSLFATLVCMNFTYEDLIPFINMDFNIDDDLSIDNFLNQYGFSSGRLLIKKFKSIISKKFNPEITFEELYEITNKTLYISASSLAECKIIYFSHKNSPDMRIVDAIRFSISIPFIFTSPRLNDKYYIDGGIFERYPLKCFDQNKKTLAFNLINKIDKIEKTIPNEINGIGGFVLNIILFTRKHLKDDSDFKNIDIINIDTPDINPIKFDLDINEKKELIKCGYRDTLRFFI